MKHYTCSVDPPCKCGMEECDSGEYVLYEDYERLLLRDTENLRRLIIAQECCAELESRLKRVAELSQYDGRYVLNKASNRQWIDVDELRAILEEVTG